MDTTKKGDQMSERFETGQEIYLNDKQVEMKNYAQIMSKLQKLRDEIKGIKAKGHNKFNNFDYIRLKDILNLQHIKSFG